MITKERLEKLIEQGVEIWYINKNNLLNREISPDTNIKDIIIQPLCLNDNVIIYDNGLIYFNLKLPLQDLFEIKEQAEFALRFKRIPRTEYLDLPEWEEFTFLCDLMAEYSVMFRNADGTEYMLYRLNDIVIYNRSDSEFEFEKPPTKENYIEACELCRKLWLGEEVC